MILRRISLLALCLVLIGCDDDTTIADTLTPQKDMLYDTKGSKDTVSDTPVSDTPVSDSPVSDSPVSDSPVSDTPGGSQLLGEGCCAPGASNCTLGTCGTGLACFVISNGPYADRGICSKTCVNPQADCACAPTTPGNRCPGGTPSCEQGHCMWLCLPDPQGCDSSQPCKCQSDLLCLGVSGKNMCLPKGS